MYLSYIFYFKEITIIIKKKQEKKQKAKQIQKKEYRNVEGKSLPVVFDYVLPISQSSPFFFSLLPLQLKGGNLLVLSNICLLIIIYFFLLLAKNKSLSSSSLKWIYKFKQICFPPKLAANEQLQKCFFG